MFNKYYRQELQSLRESASEYSKAYPAIAPMLDGVSSDPDVERILEGTAFLTGLVRQKIDDEFPEIVQELIRNVWPHYLRPVPSATIIEFNARQTLQQSAKIKKDVYLDSAPVDGTSCRFKTIYDLDIHPLEIKEISFNDFLGKKASIKIKFTLDKINLSTWNPENIRFYLADTYTDASYLYLLLFNFLSCIKIKAEGAKSYQTFSSKSLKNVGFGKKESLLPFPTNVFPGYRLIQEYFLMPEKFLFLEFPDIKEWTNRGTGNNFEMVFELDRLPDGPPVLTKNSFKLHVAPAINIFPHDADPIYLDHKKHEHRVRPTTDKLEHYQIYSIDSVLGFLQGASKERKYNPFHKFGLMENTKSAIYNESLRVPPAKNRIDHYISTTNADTTPEMESLSITLTCTNGFLAEHLETGDINLPAETTPEFVSFTNIRKPTVSTLPSFNNNYLWQLLSMLSLNNVSLSDVESFKSLLNLYIFEGSHDKVSVLANKKRVEGIKAISTKNTSRLAAGYMMRGKEIRIKVNKDHYAGLGDMYLFGTMLSHFTAQYTTINSFTRLIFEEVLTGETFTWRERIGDRYLI
ncbi:MAG: type VI secretion system baseplate subunit TssF [Desulfobacteraceae bacterium]|nr:type VI secretion system baseplate subunit TssF [Desulfobacteraceae bacterium]